MEPPAKSLIISKEEAASRQTGAAIEAFLRGDFDIAITLAGAAEGQLDRPGMHMFAFLRDHSRVKHIKSKKWISVLNRERDWLKHVTPHDAPTLTLRRADAAFMIARAASKLQQWTPQMETFKVWLIENLDALAGESDA